MLFEMHPDKAPGPDGMSPAFFQKHWSIVGKNIVEVVKSFLETGELLPGLNDTNIVLIPKNKNPTTVTELRPIALCNVLMKIVTKVIANRLKEVLNTVVSDTQSAFIPGRLISDNIMISFEVMHYLKRKNYGKEGFMALKLDMSKAYDRIEWVFLEAILKKMGFSETWVQRVLKCVTSVAYNIVHGEFDMGPIVPSRGIRQGDPLSPYLFIICAEGLSALIRKYESNKWIHGIKICRKAPVVSHMLFADDSYFYCKADTNEARKVMELLAVYERASGQKINTQKSSAFFSSNVIQYNKEEICRVLQMGEADAYSKYLGLPNVLGRNKSVLLGYLKERVRSKISSWDGKWVSKSGKVTLIKSVVQALPTFAMNVFLLPLEISKDIERSLSKFWWSTSQDSKITWMCWDRLTVHKDAGGLGFRNFRDFNLAMLGKQCWRLLTNPDSLVSRLYKARYYGDADFLNSKLGGSPSFIWRSILAARDVILKGVRWRVGAGKGISIVGQPWLQCDENPFITTVSPAIDNNSVSALMCIDRKEWDLEVVRDIFNERDKQCILDTHIEEDSESDCLYWQFENSGEYSVRSAYKMLQVQKGAWGDQFSDSIWKLLWRIQAPPKVLNLVWRALANCLPVLTLLQLRHVPVSTLCPDCRNEVESSFHALVGCQFARQCWRVINIHIQVDHEQSFSEWLEGELRRRVGKDRALVVTVCWAIWRARNEKVWNNKASLVNNVVATSKEFLTQWTAAQGRSTKARLQPMADGDGADIWVKPQLNTVKITVDAANFDEQNAYGIGLIAWDCTGALLEAKMKLFQGNARPEFAEAMAIKEALSWTMRWGELKVVIESDCLVVIQAIRSKALMRSSFGGIIMECRKHFIQSNNLELYFVKRSANMAAHTLARASHIYSDRSFNRGSVPIEVKQCIEADLS